MKNRIICYILVTTLIFSVGSFHLNASPVIESNSAELTEYHDIITHHHDGSVSKRTFTYIPSSTRNLNVLIKDPYLPSPPSNRINISRSTTDSNGRSRVLPADPRVICLRARYDTDGDGVIDYEPFKGTASLQSYDVAISAGHCVWSPSLGWPDELECYLGRTSLNSYATMVTDYSISIGQDFVDNSYVEIVNGKTIDRYDFNHDWSIIILNDNVGGTYGWFGLHGCGSAEYGLAIEVYGYPQDKDYCKQQWKSTGTLGSFDSNIIEHNAYSIGGMSGGPLLNNDYVYGIHSHRNANDHFDCGAIRMDDWLFELIVSECEISEDLWG